MMIPRNLRARALAKLDTLVMAIQHETEGSEADPFDDAMVAAVLGVAETMRAESAELEAVRGRMVRLARQLPR